MALMDELSARLHRQDGARFNEEVLPLLSSTSNPGPNPNPNLSPSLGPDPKLDSETEPNR